ncbi:unnamed protein product [Brassica rapa]|uniref:Uncharacterized protein n=2 Tax=Brassica TaxID=3705 RepID=A0A8D9DCA4_BRACM|nr:unnamed protein product [Brassica napus]CAG7874685.1 unnamed protein product [Brassica rapa]
MMLHPRFTFTTFIRFPRYDSYSIFIFGMLLKRTLN